MAIIWNDKLMKKTSIPGAPFRRAKSGGGQQNIAAVRPWMKSFGKLRALSQESKRINRIIQTEFDRVEPEDIE